MDLNLLKTFVKVAETGSFTKASKLLNQPKSRVSRAIARLEEETKTELLKRTTRSTSLTEAGKELYQGTYSLIDQLESKIESVAHEGELVSGILSLSAPFDLGESILPALLQEFSELHPQLRYRVVVSDAYIDLAALNIDVALRVGNLRDSSLRQKKLSNSQLILVASAEYCRLKGVPNSLGELKEHPVFSFSNENQRDPLADLYKKYGVEPLLCANSFLIIKKMVTDSKGIGVLPSTICTEEVSQGEVLQLLPEWKHQKSTVQLVYSSTKNLPLRVRAFIDFMGAKDNLFHSS